MTTKSVVLLGKGELAVRAAGWLHANHNLTHIIPVIPEPGWTSSLTWWARAAGIHTVETGDYRDLPANIRPDLAVSVFYDRIINPAFIGRCGRIINLHNAPLPHYRGVSPINWALKNGETRHGVTIHEITPGIDDGPIIAQTLYPIWPDIDEVQDVYHRAIEHGWTLFKTTMPILDQIVPVEQDHTRATYYHQTDNQHLGERRSFTRQQSVAT